MHVDFIKSCKKNITAPFSSSTADSGMKTMRKKDQLDDEFIDEREIKARVVLNINGVALGVA